MNDIDDLVWYYLGFDNDPKGHAGLDYWENRTRLFIVDQLRYDDLLMEWCYGLDWVGC